MSADYARRAARDGFPHPRSTVYETAVQRQARLVAERQRAATAAENDRKDALQSRELQQSVEEMVQAAESSRMATGAPAVLESLSQVVLRREETTEYTKDNCAICCDGLTTRCTVFVLGCCHLFHVACLRKWHEHNRVCPTCKTPTAATVPDVADKRRNKRLARQKADRESTAPGCLDNAGLKLELRDAGVCTAAVVERCEMVAMLVDARAAKAAQRRLEDLPVQALNNTELRTALHALGESTAGMLDRHEFTDRLVELRKKAADAVSEGVAKHQQQEQAARAKRRSKTGPVGVGECATQ
jgi:hypothetical protein